MKDETIGALVRLLEQVHGELADALRRERHALEILSAIQSENFDSDGDELCSHHDCDTLREQLNVKTNEVEKLAHQLHGALHAAARNGLKRDEALDDFIVRIVKERNEKFAQSRESSYPCFMEVARVINNSTTSGIEWIMHPTQLEHGAVLVVFPHAKKPGG
jgi:hypothetical protein